MHDNSKEDSLELQKNTVMEVAKHAAVHIRKKKRSFAILFLLLFYNLGQVHLMTRFFYLGKMLFFSPSSSTEQSVNLKTLEILQNFSSLHMPAENFASFGYNEFFCFC